MQRFRSIRVWIAHFCLITALLLWSSHSFAGQFKVTRVYDGKTVKAVGPSIEMKVRLAGIDAPEAPKAKKDPGQPFSQEARQYLAGLILNKMVNIEVYVQDGHGGILGVITMDGKNINLDMVKEGFAEVYRDNAPDGFDLALYQQAKKEAREAKRGMWTQGERYVSPREWRKIQKRKWP